MLRVIEQTNFSQLSPTWRSRGEKHDDSYPGRIGPEADSVYYDRIARRLVGEDDASRLASRERDPIPEGHRVGFDFDVSPSGWVGMPVAGDRNEDNDGNYSDAAGVGTWGNDAVMEDSGPAAVVRYNLPSIGPSAPAVVIRSVVSPSTPAVEVSGRNVDCEADVIRRFIREVGVDECHLTGSWVELRGYVRGHFS